MSLDIGTGGVHHLQGDVDDDDDDEDVVGEEQEVAIGGHRVTEVGGDLGCWGRAGRAPRAAIIGVCWLCLEIHIEIHPALSPAGPLLPHSSRGSGSTDRARPGPP